VHYKAEKIILLCCCLPRENKRENVEKFLIFPGLCTKIGAHNTRAVAEALLLFSLSASYWLPCKMEMQLES
jgi:hypothetical protein